MRSGLKIRIGEKINAWGLIRTASANRTDAAGRRSRSRHSQARRMNSTNTESACPQTAELRRIAGLNAYASESKKAGLAPRRFSATANTIQVAATSARMGGIFTMTEKAVENSSRDSSFRSKPRGYKMKI